MNRFTKTIAATSLIVVSSLVASPTAQANGINVDIEQCKMDLAGTLGFQHDVLTLSSAQQTLVIDAQQQLTVDGTVLTLTPEQRSAVESYYYNIKAAIPIGVEFAAQGLEIANLAVNEVFAELLGPDDELIIKMNELMTNLSGTVQNSIYAPDGSIYIDPQQDSANQWASPEWEAEFADALKSAISDSMGRLFLALGSEMLFGDGDMQADFFNPDALGQRVTDTIGMHASQFGESAELLCDIIRSADAAEVIVAQRIPELAQLNMITVTDNSKKDAQ
jgi:hypothetical protein